LGVLEWGRWKKRWGESEGGIRNAEWGIRRELGMRPPARKGLRRLGPGGNAKVGKIASNASSWFIAGREK